MNMNLSAVKPTLEKLSCAEHGNHPTITINGNDLSVSCCCEAFKAEIGQRAKELIAEQVQKQIEDTLSNAFKF